MSVLKLNVINRVFLLFFSLSSIVNAELWHVKLVHGGEKSYPFFYKEFEGIDLESSKIIKSSVESPRIPAILEPEGYVLEAKKIEQNNSNKNDTESANALKIIHTSDTKFIYKTFEDYFNVDEK